MSCTFVKESDGNKAEDDLTDLSQKTLELDIGSFQYEKT